MNAPVPLSARRRKLSLRSFGALALTGAFVFGLAAPAAQAEEPADTVASFTFDEAPVAGAFVAGDARATVRGTAALVAGQEGQGTAARLGSGFWLDLAKTDGSPLLQGLDAVTFSYDSKPESGNQGWAIFAPRAAAAQVYQQESYLGVIDTEAAINVERYNNAGTRDSAGNIGATASRIGWKHVDLVLEGGTAKLYVNRVLVQTNTTGKPLSEILGATGGALQIGKGNWGAGEYFTGLIDNLTITPRALADAEIVPPVDQIAQQDLADIEIANAAEVRGNFAVPSVGVRGSAIAWEVTSGAEFATLGDGITADTQRVSVTRPAAGAAPGALGLRATVTNGAATAERDFALTVTPQPAAAADPEGYVWAFFTGEGVGGERISLAASKGNNALSWNTLGGGEPLFTSELGEQGLRDPFVIRSNDGDKFYMLATDLKIDGRPGGFTSAQINGSLGIEIWESTDLVNWTAQRHAVINTPFAGNTWAPEAYWDDELGSYVVYWASNLYDKQNPTERTATTYNRMMYVTTDDFATFSEPQVWIDVDRRGQAGAGSIDVSVQKVGDEYVRVYKDENSMSLRQEKSSDLRATVGGAGVKDYSSTVAAESGWQQMGTGIGNGTPNGYGGTFTGGEGPSLFKANPADVNGYEYYLFADQPNYHQGPNHYVPMATTDIMDAAAWEVIGDEMPVGAFPANSDGGKPRHGTIIPVTKAEQDAVLAAFAPDSEIASYDPMQVSTMAGVAPALPEQVTLHKASGASLEVPVAWAAVPAANYATAGASFTVAGIAQDASHHPVEVTVEVTEKPKPVDGLIAAYEFSQTTGASVANSGGNAGPAVVQRQADSQWTGTSLKLTGGSKTGTGNWVRLPNDLLTGANSATITTEVKLDATMKSNYNFLWNIGAEGNTQQYFFTSARDASRTAITTNSNAGEASAQAKSNLDADRWYSLTTVLDGAAGELRYYIDGALAARVSTALKPSDIADQTMNTIGRSPWPDALFKGEIGTFRVYEKALSDERIAELSDTDAGLHADAIRTRLQAQLDALTVPSGDVASDYVGLPTAGGAVTWTSSDPAVVGTDGTVRQPELGGDPIAVTLTAQLRQRGIEVTRETHVSILPSTATPDERAQAAADRYVVPPLLSSGTRLPAAPEGIVVTPVSVTGATLDGDRLVNATGGVASVTVEVARSVQPEARVTKTFAVQVLPVSQTERLAAYSRTPTTELEANNADVALSMHLALPPKNPMLNEQQWEPLNENYGIFFPKTSIPVPATGPDPNRYTRSLVNPAVFQLADGSYGVIGTRVARGGASDGSQQSSVLIATTPDLREYTELGLLPLDETSGVNRPTAVYDSATGKYVVSWTTDGGAERHQSFADLAAGVLGAEPGTSAHGRTTGATLESDLVIDNFASGVTLTVPTAIAAGLTQRFGRLQNTGYRPFADVTTTQGKQLAASALPGSVTLDYSDTSTAELPIARWDLSGVDTSKPGTYMATGTVKQTTYPAPFADERADPSAFKYDFNGTTKYLMIATNDPNLDNVNQGGKAFMPVRIADSLAGLADEAGAKEVKLLSRGDTDAHGSVMTGCFWAPEFHEINGKLSILFMPCYGSNPDYISGRASIMQLGQDAAGNDLDPAVPANWTKPEHILRADGSPLNGDVAVSRAISLDMTFFSDAAGTSYYAWQQNCSTYIAEVDPGTPNRITTDPVRIVAPEYAWDNSCAEGPNVHTRGDKLYMIYSGSSVGNTYTTGLAMAPAAGANLSDPATWQKLNSPLQKSGLYEGSWQLGTGHGMWSEDEDGNLIYVFHARTNHNGLTGRDMFVRRVHFDAEGIPVLDMEASEELATKTVQLKVVVKDGPVKPDPVQPCAKPSTKQLFIDVPRTHKFFRQIDWLKCSGYTTGIATSAGLTYAPQQALTREAMAAMLYRLEAPKGFTAPKTSPFADVRPSDKFYREIAWMHATGLSTGVKNPAGGKPSYQPKAKLSREAMAAFIYRLEAPKGFTAPAVSPVADLKRGDRFYREVSWLVTEGLSTGIKVGSGKPEFRSKAALTREAMAAFLYRLATDYRER